MVGSGMTRDSINRLQYVYPYSSALKRREVAIQADLVRISPNFFFNMLSICSIRQRTWKINQASLNSQDLADIFHTSSLPRIHVDVKTQPTK